MFCHHQRHVTWFFVKNPPRPPCLCHFCHWLIIPMITHRLDQSSWCVNHLPVSNYLVPCQKPKTNRGILKPTARQKDRTTWGTRKPTRYRVVEHWIHSDSDDNSQKMCSKSDDYFRQTLEARIRALLLIEQIPNPINSQKPPCTTIRFPSHPRHRNVHRAIAKENIKIGLTR